jgi:hypothetical protein
MSASAKIFPVSQTTTPTNPSNDNPKKPTYLSRCIEDLSLSKVASCERKALFWNIIWHVSAVAFTTLAVGTFLAISVHVPIYAPFVGIGSLLLAASVVEWIKQFKQWSETAHNEGEKYRAIQREYTDLKGQTREAVQRMLSQMGITCDPSECLRLTPLLAQANYLEKKTLCWVGAKTRNAAKAIESPNIAMYRVLECEDQILNLKIQNAFVHAVLRKPDFCGTLKDLGNLAEFNYQDRLIRKALSNPTDLVNPNGNDLFTFYNLNLAPITSKDVETMTVADLGQRFFAAMT